MRRPKAPTGSGQQLLADFQTAFVSSATIEAAKYEAARSENALLDHLSAIGGGTYLQPGNLTVDEQDNLTRNSLDAHIKKVQAQQLNSMNLIQLQQLQAEVRATYIGRKLTITPLDIRDNVFESVWFDQRSGFRSNVIHKKKISGVIQDIVLDRNVIILRPTLRTRLVISNLENYMAYIIDPVSLMPLVDLQLD